MSKPSAIIIRWSLAGLYLWFGTQQLLHPSQWTDLLPVWTGYLPVPGEMFISLNGWMEVVLGGALFLGLYARIAALILGAHLVVIALSVGGSIGVRDFVLALTTLALALSAPDAWTLDTKIASNSPLTPPSPPGNSVL